MNTAYYEHKGKHLTSEIAAEFIFTKYCGQDISTSVLSKELSQYHKDRGGLAPSSNLFNEFDENEVCSIVRSGLKILRDRGCARIITLEHPHSIRNAVWSVHDIKDDSVYPKTIGEGTESVYLYYCPAYRERAESRVPVWKKYANVYYECNIGRSVRTATSRVKEKIKGLPETPILALTMKTDKSEVLEKIIHNFLIYDNRQCQDSQRTDWFYTNPEEVEGIFEYITNYKNVLRSLLR
ncbi:MAG: hypothetical protein OXI24_12255 [Candidatus Poribacteria bacterium]|nr:hypothetical protein [Candidatus Poribacteria bacterium]